jgi:hypothetical protein
LSKSLNTAILQSLHSKLAEFRDLQLEIADREEQLKKKKELYNELRFRSLPDLFDEHGIDHIGVPAASDNLPAYDAEINNYYHASIAAAWPPSKRQEAFDELRRVGGADIVETVVSVRFARANANDANILAETLRVKGYQATVEPYIPWQRLTAWLKQHIEQGGLWPDLEKIGGNVGRIVKLTLRSDPERL